MTPEEYKEKSQVEVYFVESYKGVIEYRNEDKGIQIKVHSSGEYYRCCFTQVMYLNEFNIEDIKDYI